jgi:hypothetical protein
VRGQTLESSGVKYTLLALISPQIPWPVVATRKNRYARPKKEFGLNMEEDSTDKIFAVNPPPPDYNPVKQAVKRAEELGEKPIATTLGYFATMPASTGIIANPVLHHTPVDCNGTTITLDIRSFTIRGTVPESDIVAGKVGPIEVIYTGLFGSQKGDAKELAAFIDQKYFQSLSGSLIEDGAAFVKKFPGLGPEVAMHHFSILAKAKLGREEHQACTTSAIPSRCSSR